MKRNFYIVFLSFFLLIQPNMIFAEESDNAILLQTSSFEHIKFKKVKPNHHLFINQQLQINVNESASFLMQAFDHTQLVRRVSFEWRSDNLPRITNAQHEKQRSGDDAVFKLGLLLKTEESLSNPFIPKWMQQVESLLKFPSEDMIYLVANAKHKIGERWANPYNKRVTMISISSYVDQQGWNHASYQFESPVNVVALWLMSDGDNTNSSFTTRIKNIFIE
ncbi:hypothetical protein MNBD_GAMMA05-1606 [hydrothermal vent metagenome]|uniref:DUF3047 domain-containing protein n=1 Tax=hydrothermal vent metagenome TaxID=652676 RepID=A0A3B0XB99_9ZZZZ